MQWIYADDGQPFRSRGEALQRQAQLRRQMGSQVGLEIRPQAAGGYAIACEARATAERAAAAPTYPQTTILRPALRAFLPLYVKACFGVWLFFSSHWVLQRVGLAFRPGDPLAALVSVGLQWAGALYFAQATAKFLWAYLSHRYLIDAEGAMQMEWYYGGGLFPRRRVSRVNFAQLRTVDVDQGFLQTLLNIGTVRLAAGGTDTYEVVLQRVSAPHRLRTQFQLRQSEIALRSRTEQITSGQTASAKCE